MSTQPSWYRKPREAQSQPAGTQYTIVLTSEKMQYALKSNRSAIAPDTMGVAVVANDIWKMKPVKVGPILTPSSSTNQSPKPMNQLVMLLSP